jgi:hypothetical protein
MVFEPREMEMDEINEVHLRVGGNDGKDYDNDKL